MVPAVAVRVRGACGSGGHASVRPTPPAPPGSWGHARASAARASPYRRIRRTSCGRDLLDDLASSTSRCRSRPRRTPLPPPAGRRRADRRRSARALGQRRRSGCLGHVRPVGAAALRRAHPPCPVRMHARGRCARGRPPRPHRRIPTNPIRSRLLGRGLLGRDRRGCACGPTTNRWTRRRRPAPCRRCRRLCRRSVDPARWACASAPRPSPFVGRDPFAARAPFVACAPGRRPCSWAPALPGSALSAPHSGLPARAPGRGSPAHPRGRSVVGRSGEARFPPAPAAPRPRSLDPSLLPSLGARGRSGSSTVGCGCAVLRDERSVTRAAASAACRAEDLLVQPFVPVRGRAACLANLLGPPAASRATSTRFFPHLGRRGSAAGPGGARLYDKDNSPRRLKGQPGSEPPQHACEVPIGVPPSVRHARCELVLLS